MARKILLFLKNQALVNILRREFFRRLIRWHLHKNFYCWCVAVFLDCTFGFYAKEVYVVRRSNGNQNHRGTVGKRLCCPISEKRTNEVEARAGLSLIWQNGMTPLLTHWSKLDSASSTEIGPHVVLALGASSDCNIEVI